ncbi:hypothetical protein BRE01_58180 [Brevibacillus reuszeri]|uniref:Uncharacterized protein n=1 Tax=Brevibacillus reuszeri TaxID=54915 RepID=A0A0K9YUD8_9BACL|nr:hypothetical protein [Brevibacillus reuszeri]KNB72267.1 hypothetical protein ADS79_10200 [Brevibacillus reuszeri]MED1855917.1 hypothetical protein [Brevibacillus reuszeri]GED72116.1 hypothetical protein BRE01_58180 [Brevibacillus reuszeri]
MTLNQLEKRLEDLCLEILCDLRPCSIVDRQKFDTLYNLFEEISVHLGTKTEISRRIVRNVFWIISQLQTQTQYATSEDFKKLNEELDTLMYNLHTGGLFKSIDT